MILPPRRDLVAAGLCLTAGLLLNATGRATSVDPVVEGLDLPVAVRIALLVLLCAAQTQRRVRPGLALAVAAPLLAFDIAAGVSLPVVLIVADLLYAGALHGSRALNRGLVRGTIAVCAAIVVAAFLLAADWRAALWLAVQTVIVLPTPVWWGTEVRRQREQTDAERERADRLELKAELDRREAVAAERTRVAHDLHDAVAGHLSAIALQSEAVLAGAARDQAATEVVLRAIRENSLLALGEMRTMIDVLLDGGPSPDPAGRVADLGVLLDSARAAGLEVTADTEPPRHMSSAVEVALYRIAQEALTNAVSHGEGAAIDLQLAPRDRGIELRVTNAFHGEREVQRGTGLTSMQERARLVGGELTAGPDGPDGAWQVRAMLPADRTSAGEGER